MDTEPYSGQQQRLQRFRDGGEDGDEGARLFGRGLDAVCCRYASYMSFHVEGMAGAGSPGPR